MIAGSLFSGIEGFGLGLLWSGLITEIAFQVEVDPFCRRVLAARFPRVDRSVQDVRHATAQSLPRVDLLFGGPPCQDISGAGKGAGLDGERSGLVREMLRLVGELGPVAVLIENVASGKRRWVCPVRGALEALGYRTASYEIGVEHCGGPHRRRRLFVLAYAYGPRFPRPYEPRSSGVRWSAECARVPRPTGGEPGMGHGVDGLPPRVVRWPAGPGAPQEAWEPPRVASQVEERAAKLKAIGNAVSPIQAYHVGLWAIDVLKREGVL